jgi:hypothetical protein
VLGCSGRGYEVLGFINFWDFLMVGDLIVLKKYLLQGVRLHLIGSTEYEAYHFGTKRPGSTWLIREVIQRGKRFHLFFIFQPENPSQFVTCILKGTISHMVILGWVL